MTRREPDDEPPPREPIEISDDVLDRARERGPKRNREPRRTDERMKAFFAG